MKLFKITTLRKKECTKITQVTYNRVAVQLWTLQILCDLIQVGLYACPVLIEINVQHCFVSLQLINWS